LTVRNAGLDPARSPVVPQPVPRSWNLGQVALPLQTVAAIAAGLACSCAAALPELSGDGSRRYVRLLETAAYDAWLIAWEPAADLDLHDHGGSAGAFHVVRGRLVEVHTDLQQRHPLETLHLRAGCTRQVTAERVHRVWNPGPGEALSVHVYSPPLASMTFYDDRPGRFLAPLETRPVDGAPEAEGPR
jgi:cysteine dioxygenase type I